MRNATNKKSAPVPAKKTKHQAPVPVPAGAVYISAKQVLARYGGRSEMWLNRKLTMEADFPRPMYSGRLRFFRLDEIEQYEKLSVTRGRRVEA